jgi:allantoicase
MEQNAVIPDFVNDNINLAHQRLDSKIVYVTDDFFAPAHRMLQAHEAEWKEDVYDDNGKWMDGWESRRKRSTGYDYAILQLGKSGQIKGFEIDTTYFTGNYAPAISVQGCCSIDGSPDEQTEWYSLVETTPIVGNKKQYFQPKFDNDDARKMNYTHIRLNMYPDGGIARFRVYGTPSADHISKGQEIDLIAMENGGRAVLCNDEHFGKMNNLLMPGKGINMGDGWETRRRREPGNDWVIIALGQSGLPQKALIDTAYFKGNFPHQVSIQAAFMDNINRASIAQQSLYWQEILTPQKLSADNEHQFDLQCANPVNIIRMNIYPDGGISRLRLFGKTV